MHIMWRKDIWKRCVVPMEKATGRNGKVTLTRNGGESDEDIDESVLDGNVRELYRTTSAIRVRNGEVNKI